MLRLRGFSLVELMVVVVIASILLALAVPAFSSWLVNARIRNVATTFLAGLQQARSEAISRNAQIRFQSVDVMTSACSLTPNGSAWVINRVMPASDDVSGKCNVAADPSGATAPYIVAKSALDTDSRVSVTASASSVVFNSLGRIAGAAPTATTYNFTASTNGACASDGGALTCLRVIVSSSGQVRMCNPSFPAGDPQGCS